jgi:hypothetical protein
LALNLHFFYQKPETTGRYKISKSLLLTTMNTVCVLVNKMLPSAPYKFMQRKAVERKQQKGMRGQQTETPLP